MGDDTVSVWRVPCDCGHVGCLAATFDDRPPFGKGEPGVWRPVPADARRDRIVRAAEAWHDAQENGTHDEIQDTADEIMDAVAAGRETT